MTKRKKNQNTIVSDNTRVHTPIVQYKPKPFVFNSDYYTRDYSEKSDNTRVYNPIRTTPVKVPFTISDNYEFIPIYDDDYHLTDFTVIDKDTGNKYNKNLLVTYNLLDKFKDNIREATADGVRTKLMNEGRISRSITLPNGKIVNYSGTTEPGLEVEPLGKLYIDGISSAPIAKPIFKFIKNIPHINRFFYNNLKPSAYKGHTKEIKSTLIDMATQKAPKFGNGVYPKWYNPTNLGTNDVRLETWARRFNIPEKEIPNTMIHQRADGTYGFTEKALEKAQKPNSMFRDLNVAELKGRNKVIDQDWMTTIGGEHSDFIKKQILPNGFHEYRFMDDQKLNPQWVIADKLKRYFKIPAKYTDGWGSIDLGPIIGAKNRVLFNQDFVFDPNEPLTGFFKFSPY